MELNTLLQYKPYSTARPEKRALYAGLLTELTQFHRERCPEYGRLLDALGCPPTWTVRWRTPPMLPVSLFKELELRSIPEERYSRPLPPPAPPGSGCPGFSWTGPPPPVSSRPSARSCPTSWGERRLPLPGAGQQAGSAQPRHVLRPGAGILGFSIFGTRPCYALDEHMELDLDGVRAFLEEHQGETIFLFGFTFIIWKHVVRALEERGGEAGHPQRHPGSRRRLEEAGRRGGVPGEFKARVAAATGVERVSNYYGMAEQTGCIYMECPQGHLHASLWSDIVVRRGRDYRPCEPGEEGVLQVLSLLPCSYPGHSLLTEEPGAGGGGGQLPREGKYFKVTGGCPGPR